MKSKLMEKIRKLFISNTDPSGSYTGTPVDGGKPEQDADDL